MFKTLLLNLVAFARIGYAQQAAVTAYNPNRICDDAFEHVYDHSHEQITHFDVELGPGCFGSTIRLPAAWKTWFTQPLGDTKGWWWAFWPSGQNQMGPFTAKDSDQKLGSLGTFRLQGQRKIRFYSNDVAEDPPQTNNGSAPKPDDGGVYTIGGRVSAPKAIFKPEPEIFPEARRAHWQGDITVSAVVRPEGLLSNIQILDAPPELKLEHQVLQALSAWRFKPGTLDGRAVPVRIKVTINFRSL
jgi:TonB family protein